jgi:hypothetical protein
MSGSPGALQLQLRLRLRLRLQTVTDGRRTAPAR